VKKGKAMKIITVWQPWAEMIIMGAKPWEFRENSYLTYIGPPKVNERIGIHAAKRPVKRQEVIDLIHRIEGGELCGALIPELAVPLLKKVLEAYKCRLLPVGAIIGTAVIGPPQLACDALGMAVEDSDRGNFNWAWPMIDPKHLDEPIFVSGKQGFWDYRL
jgi:hypothetical protein